MFVAKPFLKLSAFFYSFATFFFKLIQSVLFIHSFIYSQTETQCIKLRACGQMITSNCAARSFMSVSSRQTYCYILYIKGVLMIIGYVHTPSPVKATTTATTTTENGCTCTKTVVGSKTMIPVSNRPTLLVLILLAHHSSKIEYVSKL